MKCTLEYSIRVRYNIQSVRKYDDDNRSAFFDTRGGVCDVISKDASASILYYYNIMYLVFCTTAFCSYTNINNNRLL